MKDTKIIAVTGKGGVGKTSLAAVIVKLLVEQHPDKKILAIDADPAVGLATALNVSVDVTIDQIRKEVVETVEGGDTKSAIELLGEARYRIPDAIKEEHGFAFMAVGRPEAAGCYCKVNAYLKEVIKMVSEQFDYVVIDGEAGIEQINRRVMETVTHLLLISDASRKGIQVIHTIKQVADELTMYDQIGAIINRVPDLSICDQIDTGEIPVLAYIGGDSALATCDMLGNSVMDLPENALIVEGARTALAETRGL